MYNLNYTPILLAREWTVMDTMLIVGVIIVAVVALLYFLNRAAYKKMDEQQEMINQTKMNATIFVIDKKRDKLSNVNLPKVVQSQIPAYAKWMKMYLVQAKIGPQIMTLICDKNVYNAIPLKKTVKAEIAGIYIVKFAGMKTEEEMKKIRKEKKEKEKELKKEEKKNKKK